MNMHVLDKTGHTTHSWNSDNEAEVEAARSLFASLTGKGYRAFVGSNADKPGRRMDSFDPSVEEMTFVPQLRGG
jgi:hypothetical protein